jgi:hypothetical protein
MGAETEVSDDNSLLRKGCTPIVPSAAVPNGVSLGRSEEKWEY